MHSLTLNDKKPSINSSMAHKNPIVMEKFLFEQQYVSNSKPFIETFGPSEFRRKVEVQLNGASHVESYPLSP